MSIATEITRLQGAKADIKTSIENKGVTVPISTTIDGYNILIDSIPSGGEGNALIDDVLTYTNDIKEAIFRKLEELPELTIPNSANSSYFNFNEAGIKKCSFKNCNQLISLYQAFQYCSSLESVSFDDTSRIVNMQQAFRYCTSLTTGVDMENNSLTNIFGTYQGCTSLVTAPKMGLSTASVTIGSTFSGCTNLVNVPVYNLSGATGANGMFTNCGALSDESLNNILASCISGTRFSSYNKSLSALGFNASTIAASRWQACSNYSAFTSAGWTIGY